MDHPTKALGVVIDAALADSGLSLREVAESTGIPRTTLTRRRLRGDYTISELSALSEVLGVKVSDLIARAETSAA